MGRLNQGIIRRKQASLGVGVESLDFSKSRKLQAIATAAGQVNRQLHERQEYIDGVQALKEVQLTDLQLREGIAGIKSKYNSNSSLDPKDGFKEISAFTTQTINSRYGDIPSRRVRQKTAILNQRLVGKYNNDADKWSFKLQGLNTVRNINESLNIMSALVHEDGTTYEGFEETVRQANEVARLGAASLNEKQGAGLIKNAPKSLALSYLDGLMQRNPEQGIDEFKNKKLFEKIFTGKERAAIDDDFAKAVVGKNLRTKISGMFDDISTFGQFVDPIRTGTLQVAQITEVENQYLRDHDGKMPASMKQTFNSLKDMVLSGKTETSVNDIETVLKLKARIEKLLITRAGDSSLSVPKNVTLAEVNNVINDVLTAYSNGQIKAGAVSSMLMKPFVIAEKLAGETSEAETEITLKKITRAGINAVRALFGDPGAIKDLRGWNLSAGNGLSRIASELASLDIPEETRKQMDGEMSLEFYRKIEEATKLGQKLTPAFIDILTEEIIKEGKEQHGIANEAEDGDVSYLDPVSGKVFKKKPSGTFEMVA